VRSPQQLILIIALPPMCKKIARAQPIVRERIVTLLLARPAKFETPEVVILGVFSEEILSEKNKQPFISTTKCVLS